MTIPTPPRSSSVQAPRRNCWPPSCNNNHTFQFTVTNAPGQLTIVQASTNLVTWVPIYTNATGGIDSFTDTNATSYPWRFYRVIAP